METVKKYRKKPVIVEAIKWNGLNLKEIKEFVGKDLECIICDTAWKIGKGRPHVIISINTIEGKMTVHINDYIIKGINDEFYLCNSDTFNQTYEEESSN